MGEREPGAVLLPMDEMARRARDRPDHGRLHGGREGTGGGLRAGHAEAPAAVPDRRRISVRRSRLVRNVEVEVKRVVIVCALVAALGSAGAFAQSAVYGISAGAGFGDLNESFTMSGEPASLVYAAPAGFIDFEMDWGSFYLDMGLGVLFMPVTATLGGTPLNLNGYRAIDGGAVT